MKTLLLVRHAKSSWDNPSLSDFDRTLTERGKSDATMMANRIISHPVPIDVFISSPAKRAKKTARIFMKEYGRDDKDLLQRPSLYEASVNDYYEVVDNLDDHNNSAAIFGHNPTITEFINSLHCSPIYNMPTCAVFALNIKTEHWKDFIQSEKEFLLFDYPKNGT